MCLFNLNTNSILTHQCPILDVRLGHTSSGSPHAFLQAQLPQLDTQVGLLTTPYARITVDDTALAAVLASGYTLFPADHPGLWHRGRTSNIRVSSPW